MPSNLWPQGMYHFGNKYVDGSVPYETYVDQEQEPLSDEHPALAVAARWRQPQPSRGEEASGPQAPAEMRKPARLEQPPENQFDAVAFLADASVDEDARLPLPSCGSEEHPDNCVECSFYFFGPSGCKMADSCKYCHVYHRRVNPKKNRKHLRRLAIALSGEAAAGDTGDPVAHATVLADSPGADMARVVGPTSGTIATLSFVDLQDSLGKADRPEVLVLLAGVETKWRSRLTFADGALGQLLRPHASFVVAPPLPVGLFLDQRSGTICGTPMAAQGCTTFKISASVPATGPGGTALGETSIASRRISIKVHDLRNYNLRACVTDGNRVELQLTPICA